MKGDSSTSVGSSTVMRSIPSRELTVHAYDNPVISLSDTVAGIDMSVPSIPVMLGMLIVGATLVVPACDVSEPPEPPQAVKRRLQIIEDVIVFLFTINSLLYRLKARIPTCLDYV